MLGEIIYLLCTILSLACTVLLLRAFLRNRVRLLFWSGLCFLGLSINNALVFVDFIACPGCNLSVTRLIPAFLGVAALCYGLIWDMP